MANITITDSLLILATVVGPIIAVQTQKFIEKIRDKKNRRIWIFHTLMATRANRTSDRHVEALNLIEIEYHDCKKGLGKQVVDAWREYLNILENTAMPRDQWHVKIDELFFNLLHEMSKFLKYDFNRVDVQKGCYSPEAHGERFAIQDAISRGFADVLSGKKSFPITVSDYSNTSKKASS